MTGNAPPDFYNAFLSKLHDAFAQTDRKLSLAPVFAFDGLLPVVWFSVRSRCQSGASIVLTVSMDQTASFQARSSSGRDLLSLKSLQLVDNPEAIVRAFESTHAALRSATEEISQELRRHIMLQWNQITSKNAPG